MKWRDGICSRLVSTITVILQPHADGTLHLPVPAELRHQAVKVKAELEAAGPLETRAKAGLWKNMPDGFWMSPDFDAPLEDFREHME